MIKEIKQGGALLALIITQDAHASGVSFLTPDNFSQQLGVMRHPAGTVIAPHVHNPVIREVVYTQETLFLRKGKLRVDFYDSRHQYLESYVLEAGDVMLLASGGHGFEVLEEIEMIEVKQGPYSGEGDKTYIPGVSLQEVRIGGIK